MFYANLFAYIGAWTSYDEIESLAIGRSDFWRARAFE